MLLALARVDERSVLLDGLLGRFDLAKAALAADWLSCCERRALLLEPRFLLSLALLLAALALGFLLGQVALDRRRRDPPRELAENVRPCKYLRFVDALPVGSRQAGRVHKPLRHEQPEHDRERGLGCAGAQPSRTCAGTARSSAAFAAR